MFVFIVCADLAPEQESLLRSRNALSHVACSVIFKLTFLWNQSAQRAEQRPPRRGCFTGIRCRGAKRFSIGVHLSISIDRAHRSQGRPLEIFRASPFRGCVLPLTSTLVPRHSSNVSGCLRSPGGWRQPGRPGRATQDRTPREPRRGAALWERRDGSRHGMAQPGAEARGRSGRLPKILETMKTTGSMRSNRADNV